MTNSEEETKACDILYFECLLPCLFCVMFASSEKWWMKVSKSLYHPLLRMINYWDNLIMGLTSESLSYCSMIAFQLHETLFPFRSSITTEWESEAKWCNCSDMWITHTLICHWVLWFCENVATNPKVLIFPRHEMVYAKFLLHVAVYNYAILIYL